MNSRFDWISELDKVFVRDGSYITPLSEKWRQSRRGRLTASGGANAIVPFGDRGIATLVNKLRAELRPDWQWKELSLPQLDWGRDYEAAALASVELAIGAEVTEPGTMFHPRRPYCSATPDGLIDGRITLQIKCPHKPAIHLDTFYNKTIKLAYRRQIAWEAWVAGAEQIIFASFDPQQPIGTRLAIIEVPIDNELVDTFERNVDRFKLLFEGGGTNTGRVTPIGIPELF